MIITESYTKVIANAINTHLPNSSGYNTNADDPSTDAIEAMTGIAGLAGITTETTIATSSTAAITATAGTTTTSASTAATAASASCIDFSSVRSAMTKGDDRSTILVILRWIVHHFKIVYRACLKKYLSHPFTLALLPLLLGLSIGFCVGWYYHQCQRYKQHQQYSSERNASNERKESPSCDIKSTHGKRDDIHDIDNNGDVNIEDNDHERDTKTRTYLKSSIHTTKQSTIPIQHLPKHISIIMDGNRRYGKTKYNSITKGHWDGSKTLIDFAKWCIAEHIPILTVYAFSTENWNRSQAEVRSLMKIFCTYCDELRKEATERGICVRVLSTETDQIPDDVANGIHKMVHETKHNTKLILNICLSYGSRGEIVNVCQSIAKDIQSGTIQQPKDITESMISSKMLTYPCPDPDLVIRTSGEYRLSNFLLWQLAYAEMFFIQKNWPELTKRDLVDIIHAYAVDRKRRFGK